MNARESFLVRVLFFCWRFRGVEQTNENTLLIRHCTRLFVLSYYSILVVM
jgi:hypothetical protein